jgi:four helix bundle suffix protein
LGKDFLKPRQHRDLRDSQDELLFDQQLCGLEREFLEEGGFKDRLHRVRSWAPGHWKKT